MSSWPLRLFRRQSSHAPEPSSASSGMQSDSDREYRECRDRGLALIREGRPEAALDVLGRAMLLRPDLEEAHLNVGRAFERAGRTEAARAAYLRASQIAPTSADARSALAGLPPPPPARVDFAPGQVVRGGMGMGNYQVLSVKRGGFGVVYVVREQERRVVGVLKTFQARYLWSDDDRDRFEREALTWVLLEHHPNIVTADWLENIEGFRCIRMEYVSGGDLSQLLQRGPLSIEQVLGFSLQFCDGIEYAHRKLGIVHRDVKPANCLLADGILKVTDFGLARAFGAAVEHSLGFTDLQGGLRAEYTSALGTLSYMAPEQFRPDAVLDTRTDIHAFGVMLYEMLTADLPLSGSVAHPHIVENLPRYSVPRQLAELILACVQPVPENRPAHFGIVREKLAEAHQVLLGRPAPPVAQPTPMSVADWNNKGLGLSELDLLQEAVYCYDQALALHGEDAAGAQTMWGAQTIWKNKGRALYGLHRYQEALECHERGLRIKLDDDGLWKHRGHALAALGRTAEAIESYDRGLQVSPRGTSLFDNGLLWGKGLALERLDRNDEALACYDEALQFDPRDKAVWLFKASLLNRLKRYAETLAACAQGLEIAPRDAGLWKAKGHAHTVLRQFDKALPCYDRAVEITPGDADSWTMRGALLAALLRPDEAIQSYDRALAIFDRALQATPGNSNLQGRRETVLGFKRDLAGEPKPSPASSTQSPARQELAALLEEKEAAIQRQDYDRAAELRAREIKLRDRIAKEEAQG